MSSLVRSADTTPTPAAPNRTFKLLLISTHPNPPYLPRFNSPLLTARVCPHTCTHHLTSVSPLTHHHIPPLAGVDKSKWKTISGQFSSVMACLHSCRGVQAPSGVSPYGHIGNGSTDLIMLTRCSTFEHAKWLFKHRRKSSCLVSCVVRCSLPLSSPPSISMT